MAHVLDYAIFGFLIFANMGVGIYFSAYAIKGNKSSMEIFLGSRSLRSFPLAMSTLASFISSLGITGLGAHFYAYGLHYLWCVVAAILVLPIVTRIIVPKLYELKVTSVFEVRGNLRYILFALLTYRFWRVAVYE